MKNKLLIVNKAQYGYHIDSYKYTVYLKDKWDITYYCFDSCREKTVEEEVKVIYCSGRGSYFTRAFRFFNNLYKLLKNQTFDVVFIGSFEFAFLIRFFSFKPKYILDIRTAGVSTNNIKNLKINSLIKLNTLFFKNITVISDGVANFLRIKKFHILPLGADINSSIDKDFYNLKLMYIGTLNSRNVYETIEGFHLFIEAFKIPRTCKYHIFGDGNEVEIQKILHAISKHKLQENVIYHGYKKHAEIKEYFDKCNIGVSFIPIVSYYNHQPPTKTYEYILSGMACIATKTYENKKVINETNGVLCSDNAASFAQGLKRVYEKRKLYNSELIRNTLLNSSWDKIVHDNLEQYINSIINE